MNGTWPGTGAGAGAMPELSRWTRKAILPAVGLTAAVFFCLPFADIVSRGRSRGLTLYEVRPALPPPPPAPLPPARSEPARPEPRSAPKPRIETPPRRLAPLGAVLDLDVVAGSMEGDWAVDFPLRPEALAMPEDDRVLRLGELDEPPQPLVRLAPNYPAPARWRRIEGAVSLEFVVTADGRVREVVVLAAEPEDVFEDAARRAVERWRFRPGVKDGQPVAVRVRQKVAFRLEGEDEAALPPAGKR